MAFKKKTWTDRVAEFINRRILTKEDGSTELVSVARSEGNISVEGDAFNAENMNDLEQRIADEFAAVNTDLSTKANAADLATKASTADLNAEKATREKVDASLQSQINDVKTVNAYGIETWTTNVTSTEAVSFVGCGRIAMFNGAILGTFPALTVITLGKLAVAPIFTKYGICSAYRDDSVSAAGHFTIDTNGVINVYIGGSGNYDKIVLDAVFMS